TLGESFGVRLHAVLAPIAHDGTCLSLRVLRPATQGLDALAASGAVPASAKALLEKIVRARLAFLVVGGTGAGKTTLLSGLLATVDPAE
ncbi:ATPase, T2SS/T4P/T4SS family, partial [Nocardia cerradoensis]